MYAYIEASQRRYNKKAVLLSPTYGGSLSDCTMVFYYHMYGLNVGSLWLKLDDINGTTVMWRYEGEWLKLCCFAPLVSIYLSVLLQVVELFLNLRLYFYN